MPSGTDAIRERIADWLLAHAFEREQSDWDALRPRLVDLVTSIRTRFTQAVAKIEDSVGALADDAPEADVAAAMRLPLECLARDIVIDRAEAAGIDVAAEGKDALRDLVQARLDTPEPLYALVRLAVGAARPGDTTGTEAFSQAVTQSRNVSMSDPVKLDNFAFDESNLPAAFKEGDFRELYLKTVRQSLDMLGNDGPSYIAAVTGLMLVEGHHDPAARDFYRSVQRFYSELSGGADPENIEKIGNTNVYLPDGSRRIAVFQAAYEVIEEALAKNEKIYFQDFARAGRAVAANYTKRPPGSAGFPSMVRAIYDEATRGSAAGGNGGGGGIGRITLPPLTDPGSGAGSDTIRPDNIRAIATIYAAFQLERTLLFQGTDRVVDLWSAGLLSTPYSEALRPLDAWRWNAEDRLTEAARWAQYSRALGAQGGAPGPVEVNANTEFNSLLLRFISIVADFQNTLEIGNIVGGRASPNRGLLSSGEGCRKAGYDLAANMSLYGWAGTYFTAERLTRHIQDAIAILDLQEVRDAFGVATWTQVLERVAVREFGVNINVAKHLTLAEETRKILNLIADKSGVWAMSGNNPLFTLSPAIVAQGAQPAAVAGFGIAAGFPGDLSYAETLSLFRSVQYWVAVNAVDPETINEFRRHAEPAPAPSLPMIGAMPAVNGGGGAPGGPGNDQLKQMLMQGQMPSMDQLKSMVGL